MIQTHNIAFSIETDVQDITEQPGSLTWVNIFKIYKEALTNVIKHSKATEVSVGFRVDRDGRAPVHPGQRRGRQRAAGTAAGGFRT